MTVGSVNRGVAFPVVMLLTATLVSTGCTTVIRSEPAGDVAQSRSDREALNRAVEELSATQWPKPVRASFGQRMAEAIEPSPSHGATGAISQEQAVATYVKALSESRDPAARLIADASAHIEAARAVIAAAAEIERSAHVRRTDVAILERAIGDLRVCRGIYSAALTEIAAVDDSVHGRRSEINRSFDAALREMGEIADAIAARTSGSAMNMSNLDKGPAGTRAVGSL